MTNIVAFHGSNAVFKEFDQSKARLANDFYGGGVAYFTDDPKIAEQYAKGMSKKTGAPVVYEVKLTLKRIFDVDDVFSGKDLEDLVGSDIDSFLRGAGLMIAGSDQYKLKSDYKQGILSVSGDQTFKGLSRGMIQTAAARMKLIKAGYNGLRYNGGLNMNTHIKHNVFLMYQAKDINIVGAKVLV